MQDRHSSTSDCWGDSAIWVLSSSDCYRRSAVHASEERRQDKRDGTSNCWGKSALRMPSSSDHHHSTAELLKKEGKKGTVPHQTVGVKAPSVSPAAVATTSVPGGKLAVIAKVSRAGNMKGDWAS